MAEAAIPIDQGQAEDAKPPPLGHTLLCKPRAQHRACIVGMPNAGKTVLFNALSRRSVATENFPFSTQLPNFSRTDLPDARFDWLCHFYETKSPKPTMVALIDLPALIGDSHKGAGLGNSFLRHADPCDTIYIVLRGFEGSEVTHVMDEVDPLRDFEIMMDQLVISDTKKAQQEKGSLERMVESKIGGNDNRVDFKSAQVTQNFLVSYKKPLFMNEAWSDPDMEYLDKARYLTSKEIIVLLNVSSREYLRGRSRWLEPLKELAKDYHIDHVLQWSGAFEQRLMDIQNDGGDEALLEYSAQHPHQCSMRERILWSAFKSHKLMHFFTCGPEEVRQWPLRVGSQITKAAGLIHRDFESGFISAEVQSFTDLRELESEHTVKAQGKLQQQGKKYIVQDGDIPFFKFEVRPFVK